MKIIYNVLSHKHIVINYLYSMLLCLLSMSSLIAQTPQGINYQAVIRNLDGSIISNQDVGLKIEILQESVSGSLVYSEAFTVTTNSFGLVNVIIGTGTVLNGDFNLIDWPSNQFFLQVSADESGGKNYNLLGTQQLVSVPYALHAKTAEIATNDAVDDADADPTNELQDWTSLPGIPNMLATMQSGEQLIGASQGGEIVVVPVSFETSFSTIPRVICTANTETGTIFDDSFNITVREVTTSGFVMIANRVDGSLWGQNLTATWIAFEP